jgi:hypothetical protein
MKVRMILGLAILIANIVVAGDAAFTEYRGVRIGSSASEVRQKLGQPKVKSDSQDLFSLRIYRAASELFVRQSFWKKRRGR